MKILMALMLMSAAIEASEMREVRSLVDKKAMVHAARVVDLVKLVEKPGLQVNILVKDLGGSTDVSPTQELYFTLYAKGEMFSTDATFNLGPIYSFKSAKRKSGGIYEVKIEGLDSPNGMPVAKTLVIDAQEAIMDLKEVECEDFDCPASTNFQSKIKVLD